MTASFACSTQSVVLKKRQVSEKLQTGRVRQMCPLVAILLNKYDTRPLKQSILERCHLQEIRHMNLHKASKKHHIDADIMTGSMSVLSFGFSAKDRDLQMGASVEITPIYSTGTLGIGAVTYGPQPELSQKHR